MSMLRFLLDKDKRRWLVAGACVAVLAVAWVIGLFAFAHRIPREAGELTDRTDAIIVLTGGSGRLGMGLKLLSEQYARKLFVSGAYRGLDVRRLLELSQTRPGEFECCVAIGYAVDTIANAAESAAWMRRNGFTSARLVTSNYHMPRSLLEFRHVLPDARLVPTPVFADHVKRDRWWVWPGTTLLIIEEYDKFLLAWVRHRLDDVLGFDVDVPADDDGIDSGLEGG